MEFFIPDFRITTFEMANSYFHKENQLAFPIFEQIPQLL